MHKEFLVKYLEAMIKILFFKNFNIYPLINFLYFTGLCATSGLLILAMPIGVISSNFSKTIIKKKHEKHLLKSKVYKI